MKSKMRGTNKTKKIYKPDGLSNVICGGHFLYSVS